MAASQEGSPSTDYHGDDFMVEVRRGSTHINSYNWSIQQFTRSNMDVKAILGDRDVRSLVYYFFMYNTKSTRTVSTIACLS